jgi:uncharacterized alkaline shock family protein YloU
VEAVPDSLSSSLGRITISNEAVAQLVGHTASECYGVVGTVGRRRVGKLLGRDRLTRGIVVRRSSEGLQIEVHVVVEYGLNLAEVAATVRSRVGYEVGRLTGLHVGAIEVHIEAVRRSA